MLPLPPEIELTMHRDLLQDRMYRAAGDPHAGIRERFTRMRRHVRARRSLVPAYGGISASLELFEGMTGAELARLRRYFTLIDLDAGVCIGRQGALCSEFAVVLEGQVAISLNGGPLGIIPPGCFFGAVSLLDSNDRRRRGSPVTMQPSVLAVADPREFAAIMSDFPVVAGRIADVAARRRASLERRAAEGHRVPLEVEFPVHVLTSA